MLQPGNLVIQCNGTLFSPDMFLVSQKWFTSFRESYKQEISKVLLHPNFFFTFHSTSGSPQMVRWVHKCWRSYTWVRLAPRFGQVLRSKKWRPCWRLQWWWLENQCLEKIFWFVNEHVFYIWSKLLLNLFVVLHRYWNLLFASYYVWRQT